MALIVGQDTAEQKTTQWFQAGGNSQPAPVAPAPLGMMRYGVAICDEDHTAGWACLPDADAQPFRFESPVGLPSDVIWICDAQYSMFNARWAQRSNVRHADYLGRFKYLAADVGFRTEGQGKNRENSKLVSKKMAAIMQQAMSYAMQCYGWNKSEPLLTKKNFVAALSEHLYSQNPAPEHNYSMNYVLASANQTYSSVKPMPTTTPDELIVVLRYNRMEYAKAIMQTCVPDGIWSSKGAPGDEPFTAEDVLDESRPCLVCVSVDASRHEQGIAELCAFGSNATGNEKSTMLRQWMTQRELMWMSRHVDVRVEQAWISRDARPLPQALQLPSTTNDPLLMANLPLSMIAEMHWKALIYTPYSKNGAPNAWSVWLRAEDRARCFALALSCYQHGFDVLSYGNGAAVLKIYRNQLIDLERFAQEQGLCHPMMRVLHDVHGMSEMPSSYDVYTDEVSSAGAGVPDNMALTGFVNSAKTEHLDVENNHDRILNGHV